MTDLGLLILDDDSYTLRLLVTTLTNWGYGDVHGVDHASEALAWVEDIGRAPDVIVCDLNLPEMDGVEFLEALARTQWRGGLILITGEGGRLLDAAHRLAGSLRLTIIGTLIKPVVAAAIAGMLDKYDPIVEHDVEVNAERKPRYSAEDLEAAIDRDEFILHYQPIVKMNDGRPSGLECLVRWRHPEDGLIHPERFIGVAEDQGLINALTGRVLEQATEQVNVWRSQGLKLPISVNLSMHTLQMEGVVEWLQQKVSDAGLSPSDVIWEVTESRAMSSIQRTLSSLSRLGLRRFGLSIDDFGTGHSSLTQLRDLPFGELKVDRGFVHDAHKDNVRAAIVEASVSMARRLGMDCVAEGVETVEDWMFARMMGCSHAQGWAIARAQPASSILGWIERWPDEFSELQARAQTERYL